MRKKDWMIWDVYVRNKSDMKEIRDDIETIAEKLMKSDKLENFYFNYYLHYRGGNASIESHYIKFGFYKLKDEGKIMKCLKEHKDRITDIDDDVPDLTVVDGEYIDNMKCMGYQLYKNLRAENPTINQMFYILHFLVDNLGFTRNEEIFLFEKLASSNTFMKYKELDGMLCELAEIARSIKDKIED